MVERLTFSLLLTAVQMLIEYLVPKGNDDIIVAITIIKLSCFPVIFAEVRLKFLQIY